MNRSTFWMIKYMNGSVFSKVRYIPPPPLPTHTHTRGVNSLQLAAKSISCRILYVWLMSALSLLYSDVGSPSLRNLSVYYKPLHDDTSFVARLWTFSIIILSFLYVQWRRGSLYLIKCTLVQIIFSFPLGSLGPLWYLWKWSSAHVYVRRRKQCCNLHYCLLLLYYFSICNVFFVSKGNFLGLLPFSNM